MQLRLNPHKAAPESMIAMTALETSVRNSGLDAQLIELVKIRASQINGCAFCIDMHTHDARAKGELEERIYLLDAWRDSQLYTARERAALAWTEAMTLISQAHIPEAVYAEAYRHFTEEELVKLTMLVVLINGWNRIAIGFRMNHPVRQIHAA